MGPPPQAYAAVITGSAQSAAGGKLLLSRKAGAAWDLLSAAQDSDAETGEVAARRAVDEALGLPESLGPKVFPVCHLLALSDGTPVAEHSPGEDETAPPCIFVVRSADGKNREPPLDNGPPDVESRFFSFNEVPAEASSLSRKCAELLRRDSDLRGWRAVFADAKNHWKVDWETLRGLFLQISEESEERFFEWDQHTGTLYDFDGPMGKRDRVWSLEDPDNEKEIWATLPMPPTDPASRADAEQIPEEIYADPEGEDEGRPAKRQRCVEDGVNAWEGAEAPEDHADHVVDPEEDDEDDGPEHIGASDLAAFFGLDKQEGRGALPEALPDEERKPVAQDLDMDMFGCADGPDAAESSDADSSLTFGPALPRGPLWDTTEDAQGNGSASSSSKPSIPTVPAFPSEDSQSSLGVSSSSQPSIPAVPAFSSGATKTSKSAMPAVPSFNG